LGRVPVEPKVAAGDGEVGGHGQFFAGTGGEQGAIVADAKAEAAARTACCPAAELTEQGKFADSSRASQVFLVQSHVLRIGQPGRIPLRIGTGAKSVRYRAGYRMLFQIDLGYQPRPLNRLTHS
jgi:hypothetical protein